MDRIASSGPGRTRDDIETNHAKRQRISKESAVAREIEDYQITKPTEAKGYHPTSIVTWNCNGFSSRARYNREDLSNLVEATNCPDVICIQEARLKADGPQRGRPLKDKDFDHIRSALQGPFRHYAPFWSLADKKYAGTLTLVRDSCLEAAGVGKNDSEGSYDGDFVAFTPSSAIDLIARRFGTTRAECGLDKQTLSKDFASPKKKQQTSLKSFFSPKKSPLIGSPKKQAKQTSLKSFFSPKKESDGVSTAPTTLKRKYHHHHEHTPEGRFQFFFFPGMDFVQTYVPNNGTKDESFARRKEWDATMLDFVRQRKQILQYLSQKRERETDTENRPVEIDSGLDRKFLWCGDMNVAATFRDGSHWQRQRPNDRKAGTVADNDARYSGNDANGDNGIYEWFRDESKCLSRIENGGPSKLPENVGIPGFTPAERRRFSLFAQEGNFCDVWRKLHPKGVDPDGTEDTCWERANYTWRGALAKNFNGFAKYQGKGQRIDYFLLSPKIHVKEIASCVICGYGTNKLGLFCGSDHCAVLLEFNQSSTK